MRPESLLFPGAVFHLEVEFDPRPPKHKFCVLVGQSGTDQLLFLINSKVSTFIHNRPDMVKCQVELARADHTFLSHDSFLDCAQEFVFPSVDILDILHRDSRCYRGALSDDARQQALAAVKHARTIRRDYQGIIISFLE